MTEPPPSLDAETSARLVRQETLASLGLMASAMAHEINNPLAGVLACVEALESGAVSEARQPEYFATIRDAVERMAFTVRSFLDYARPRTRESQFVDVADLLAGCTTVLSPVLGRRGVEVVSSVAAGHFVVHGHRHELMQAVMNVVLNAVQASSRGGVVNVDAIRESGALKISVADQGVGIAADDLDAVVEPFVTGSRAGRGTGLGLYVTKRVLEEHGGRLVIDSSVGQGTEVRFHLPDPLGS